VGDVSISGNLALTSNVTTSVDSNVVVEHKGPHGRLPKAVPLRKYPEIVFDASKVDGNDTTNTYTQAGYTVSTDSVYGDRQVYKAFSTKGGEGTTTAHVWSSEDVGGNGYVQATGDPISGVTFQDENSTSYAGHYIKLELPKKIKVERIHFSSRENTYTTNNDKRPTSGTFLGSVDGTNWTLLKTFDDGDLSWSSTTVGDYDIEYRTSINNIVNNGYFSYIVFIIEKIKTTNAYGVLEIGELEYYGYEEDPPAGDTSIDTTFTSVMNTPQTTGANVYVDGNLGETFTNRVTGPTPTGTATTYNETGKYWELTGALTSNVTLEANTFLEGDQPHSVSMWFNSSNLEANVSNTCVFSISDQEKLDSVNLDLQSNTWHNLTYAYQGEGGSRVTYLDGRKVSEDQAEDTFGDYPPFAMTGYSQGGYVVSASDEDTTYPLWRIFAGDSDFYVSSTSAFPGGVYTSGSTYNLGTNSGGPATDNGHWIKLAVPYKLKISHVNIDARTSYEPQAPKNFKFYGSNDDTNWEQIGPSFSNEAPQDDGTSYYTLNSTKAYKYIGLVVTETVGNGNGRLGLQQLKFYGHRENDLVRLPDPNRVLKYPHIPMTGPAQRGYVASASTVYSSIYEAWESFNGEHTSNDSNDGWEAGVANYNTSGTWIGGTGGNTNISVESIGNIYGDWLQIQLPHKVTVSSFKFYPLYVDGGTYDDLGIHRSPKSGYLLGSIDGTTWFSVHSWNGLSTGWSDTTGREFGVTSSTAYDYYRLVWTETVGGTYATYASAGELELFGTGVDSIPIQIGGGNIDRVANFRVYDKFVGEDQALEIWDAQKDEFGRAKSSMTLHKGRLGLGTEEPEGRLAVLDEPHNLEEFPPRAMTGYETYMEGHGVFKVNGSGAFDNGSGSIFYEWRVFDHRREHAGEGPSSAWYTLNGTYYNGVDNSYSGTSQLASGAPLGDFVKLELPYRVNVREFVLTGPNTESEFPRDFTFYGSNDNNMWNSLLSVTGVVLGTNSTTSRSGVGHTLKYTINSSTFYKYYAIVITKGNSFRNTYVGIGEWRLFGTREQGQSVLHDGQLTLTKNLDVPRIGPALDADDTPRRDRLVVEYNTSTNPTFEGAVRDTSGRGNDGVFVGTASYNGSEKALVFDGNSDYVVSGDLGIPSGAFVHSVSLWCKRDSEGSNMYLSSIGGENDATLTSRFSMMLLANAGTIHLSISGSNSTFTGDITPGSWFHIVYTYNGGAQGSSSTAHTVYVNGIEKPIDGGTNAMTLNLPENSRVALGSQPWGGSNYFDGSISNFKLYDKILTASEVKTLYDMGRCDEGHHVVNFSNTRVGIGLGEGEVPRGALDVSGGMSRGLFTIHQSDGAWYNGTALRFIQYSNQYANNFWDLGTVSTTDSNFAFAFNRSSKGYFRSVGNNTVQNFTGQHRTFIKDVPFSQASDLEGRIVSSDQNKYIKMSGGVESGSNAITMNESLPIVSLSNVAMDKKCFGVISGSEDPEQRSDEYGSFVSVTEKEKGDTRVFINSIGEGAIWVVNTNGSLESGDYITTSNVAGYGQKQDDDVLHNYTVAKITMDCDFEPVTQPVQQILRSNVVETYYLGNVHHTKTVPHEFVTTVVGADDEWSNVSVSPSDVTYAEWSNLEANTQNTYTLTYTQTSNVVYDVKYTLTTTANVTESDPWDNVYVDPPTVTYAEYSNLEANTQNTYTLTFTQTTTDTKTPEEWSTLESNTQSLYNKVYYQSVEEEVAPDYPGAVAHTRVTDVIENELDEHGQIQWEDHPTETEKAYKVRYLTADGTQTDEANAVHIAAFVGCTYHCG